MRKIFHEDRRQSDFVAQGYVQAPMLSAEEVSYVLSQLPALRPHDGFAPVGQNGFQNTYHCSFLDTNIDYKKQAYDLIEGVFAPHVNRYLNQYEILSCNFYVKPPGTGTFTIHQNWPAIADLTDTTVTVWCPLVDVVESNGALQFVPGSHKILPHVEGPNCPAYFDTFREPLIRKYLKAFPMSAGQAMIFDDGLIHWSANNGSDQARVAIQILCVPIGVQPVYFYYNPKRPERFELIAIDKEFYLTSDMTDLMTRQPQWKSLGFVENRNRHLNEEEFASLLAQGNEIRQQVYSGGWNPLNRRSAGPRPPAASRLGAAFSSVSRTTFLKRLVSVARQAKLGF